MPSVRGCVGRLAYGKLAVRSRHEGRRGGGRPGGSQHVGEKDKLTPGRGRSRPGVFGAVRRSTAEEDGEEAGDLRPRRLHPKPDTPV